MGGAVLPVVSVGMDLPPNSFSNILSNLAEPQNSRNSAPKFPAHFLRGDKDRVPHRRKGRRVAQVQFGHLFDGHSGMKGRGENIDAFRHAFRSRHLRSEQASRVAVGYQLDDDLFSAQVAGARGGVDRGGTRLETGRFRFGEVQACPGDFESQYLANRSPHNTHEAEAPARRVLSRDTSLLVGRGPERKVNRPAADQVNSLRAVAGRENTRLTRFHVFVDGNGASLSDFDLRLFGEADARANARGQDNAVRLGFTVLPRQFPHPSLWVAEQRFNRRPLYDPDAVADEFFFDESGDVFVNRFKQSRRPLEQRDVGAQGFERIGHFEADVTAPYDRGGPRTLGIEVALERDRGLEVVDVKYPFEVETRDPRARRLSPRRQDEPVIVDFLRFAASGRDRLDQPSRDRQFRDFVVRRNLNIPAGAEKLRRINAQRVRFPYEAGHVVRQTAGGVGDVGTFLVNEDLEIRIDATRPACRAQAGGYSANNHEPLRDHRGHA